MTFLWASVHAMLERDSQPWVGPWAPQVRCGECGCPAFDETARGCFPGHVACAACGAIWEEDYLYAWTVALSEGSVYA